MSRATHALALAGLVSVWPSISRGDGPARWDAPSYCPSWEHVDREARRLVLEQDWRLPENISGKVTQRKDGFTLELSFDGSRGPVQRELVAADCDLAAELAAIVLAVDAKPPPMPTVAKEDEPELAAEEPGLVPAVVLSGLTQHVVDRSGEAPVLQDPPAAEPRSAESHSRFRPTWIAAEARVGGGAVILPRIGVGFSVDGRLGWRRLGLGVGARYWLAREAFADDGSDRGGSFTLVSGQASACYELGPRRVAFPLCAGASAGAVVAAGRGSEIENPQTPTEPWVGAHISAGVSVTLIGPLRFTAAIEGVGSIARPAFYLIATGREVHRAAFVGARLWGGLAVRFSFPGPHGSDPSRRSEG